MHLKKAPNFINEVQASRFIKNRDKLMKIVENDYKFLAWICWGLDLLFVDYSYQEMYEYIGIVSDDELKKFIVPVEEHISSENIEGVILDNHFELRNEEEVVGYLIIENQLKIYSYEEISARGLAYIVASLFRAYDQVIDKKHYRLVNPPTVLWIFPDPPNKLTNHITDEPIIFPTEDKMFVVKKGSSLNPEIRKPQFQIDTDVYKFYVGNCLEAIEGPLDDKSKAGKRAYLCVLLDSIFNFDVAKEIRLYIVENVFNLKGDNIMTETEKVMNELNQWIYQYFEKGFDQGKEQTVYNLATNLIEESKEQGIDLSFEAALKRAKELTSKRK